MVKNHEFTEFKQAVNFSICRDFVRLLWFLTNDALRVEIHEISELKIAIWTLNGHVCYYYFEPWIMFLLTASQWRHTHHVRYWLKLWHIYGPTHAAWTYLNFMYNNINSSYTNIYLRALSVISRMADAQCRSYYRLTLQSSSLTTKN